MITVIMIHPIIAFLMLVAGAETCRTMKAVQQKTSLQRRRHKNMGFANTSSTICPAESKDEKFQVTIGSRSWLDWRSESE